MTTLPRSRPLVAADLANAPDDGYRYELVDGTLIVSQAASPLHQRVAFALARLLHEQCPPDLEVLLAPLDVVLDHRTVLQPDVIVARVVDLTPRDLPAPPVLAVEVLSPSSHGIDLLLKRDRLETAGCPAYWVVDPEEPGLIAYELRAGRMVEVGRVTGTAAYAATSPFAVTVVPARLVTR